MASGLIPQETIDEIATRLDIVEIINEYVPLKKQGRNLQGLCPFHHEKTPSFSVSPEKQMFHCFGCGAGGNIFTFIMQREGLTFPEAVEKLALRAGVTLNRQEIDPVQQKLLEKRERLYRINEAAARFFQKNLFSSGVQGKKALDYLKIRAFNPEIIEKFQLGLAPSQWDGLIKFFEKRGVKVQELVELGLALPNKQGTSYYDRFRNRIMFPIWDNVGRVIAFGGRVLDDSLPKYLNSPDTPLFNKSQNLYGIHLAKNNIRNEDLALIVEGYMDVIACHQHGVNNAVASLGTAFTREQAKLLMRHTYQIAIIYDGDTAGSKATLRGLDILSQLGCDVKVVSLPQGEDPDDYLRTKGPKKLRELITQSQGLIEYKLTKSMENVNANTIIGKTKVVQGIVPDLLEIKSPLVRSEAIKIVSDKIGITEANILTELRKFNRNTKGYNRLNEKKPVKKVEINKTQIQLARILFEDNSLLEEVEQAGGRELFDRPVKDIYDQISDAYKTKGKVLPSDLDENTSKILAAALLEEVPLAEHQKAVADYIKILKLNKLNREYAAKKQELKEAEDKKDVAKQVELLLQLDSILQQKKLLTP